MTPAPQHCAHDKDMLPVENFLELTKDWHRIKREMEDAECGGETWDFLIEYSNPESGTAQHSIWHCCNEIVRLCHKINDQLNMGYDHPLYNPLAAAIAEHECEDPFAVKKITPDGQVCYPDCVKFETKRCPYPGASQKRDTCPCFRSNSDDRYIHSLLFAVYNYPDQIERTVKEHDALVRKEEREIVIKNIRRWVSRRTKTPLDKIVKLDLFEFLNESLRRGEQQ